MTGFSKDAVRFFKALKKNNTREWFKDHKSDYERAIKQPAAEFSEETTRQIEKMTGLPHKAKIFRIHRDIRFSKDKTPYNSHLRISFTPLDGPASPPSWFFGLETDHVVLGCGGFGFQKQALDDWRAQIDGKQGAALVKMLSKLQAAGARLDEPELKRVPKPYDADHPRANLLRRKGLAVWLDYADAELALGDKAPASCVREFKKVKPIFDWLMALG